MTVLQNKLINFGFYVLCVVLLQAANSIALGKTRAREQSLCSGSYCSECVEPSYPGEKVLCLQIHGDAAFTGQVG